MIDNVNEEVKKEKKLKSKLFLNIVLGLSLIFIICYYAVSPPLRDRDVVIHISTSDTLTKIANEFKEKKIIKKPFLFKVFVFAFSGDKHIPKGDYLFKKDSNLINVSWQVAKGKHGVSPVRITFKEGVTKEGMAKQLADKLSSFRKDLFLSDKRCKEGYLFPDTYFFYSMSTVDEILDEINSNFNKKIISLDKEIKSSGKSLSDIIIMASILEKEAGSDNDAPIISGILWKRIELGMPLQVDAAPVTYEKSGLPTEPISNPGISFIRFAMNPKKSPYLFYLHDNNGQVHYAKDFSEHRSNIASYLR